jgi:hypothetical protein
VVVVIPDRLAVVVVVVVDARVVATEVLVTELVMVATARLAHAGGGQPFGPQPPLVGGAAGAATSASASCCNALMTEGSTSLSKYDPATELTSWTIISRSICPIIALSAPSARSEETSSEGNPFWLIVFSNSLT